MRGMWDVRTDAPRVGDGRASARPARVARPCAVVALLVIAVCLIASSRDARADIWNMPLSFDGDEYGFVAPHSYSDTGHNAAVCEMLGFDWYSLSDEVKNMIVSGPNDFVTCAYTVRNLQYESPDTDFILKISRELASWFGVYGMDQIWYYRIDPNARAAAREFVATVIQEHGTGGGGSGGGGGTSQGLPSVIEVDRTNYLVGSTFGTAPNGYFDVCRVNYGGTVATNFNALLENYPYVMVYAEIQSGSKSAKMCMYASSQPWEYKPTGYNVPVLYTSATTVQYISTDVKTVNVSEYTFSSFNSHIYTQSNSNGIPVRIYTNYCAMWRFFGQDDAPESPTYPAGPTAPTLPDPVDNSTTTNPTYPGPDVNVPITLPSITFPTAETGTDVIPYLKRIISNQESIAAKLKTWFEDVCNTITEELATHCNHIVSSLETGFGYIADTLADEFNDLQTYIRAVARFLADSIDDSLDTIRTWLARIYVKMRSGGPATTAPTIASPTDEEPFDFWAWLLDMVANLIGGVLGGATDAVSTLLNGMREMFPMSIPWDMMALLALLDGTRQIPQFDITIPAINGWWSAFTFHIDLSPYDGVASASRYMILIWWLMVLLKQSTWMIDDVMGAIGNKVAGFLTRLTRTNGVV